MAGENVTPAVPATPAPVANAASAVNVEPKADTNAPVVKVDKDGVAVEVKPKIWKLNVNGKDVEYDASDETKLKNDIQKVFGIEQKAKDHAAKVAGAEKLVDMLQSDYKGFVKQCKALNIDAQKLATDIMYEQIRLNSMSPEQRELEEYKEREAEDKLRKEQEQAESKKVEMDRKTQEWAQKFESDCTAALKANQIPKSRLALALIAQYVDAGLKEGKEYTVPQVLPFVARDLKEIHMSTMGQLDGDDLLAYVGETLSNKIAKARVDRYNRTMAQKNTPPPAPKAAGSMPKSQAERLKGKTGKAYWAELRKIKSEEGIGFLPGQA